MYPKRYRSLAREATVRMLLPAVLLLLTVYGSLTAAQESVNNPGLKLQFRKDYFGVLAREPMLVVHPDGPLFVSGYPSQVSGRDWTVPPLLWRSDDEGGSWRQLEVGTSAQGAQGNSDVDMSIGPDGSLYLISMGFNRETAEGTHIALGISSDLGSSWDWQFLSQSRFDDRPWVAVSSAGTAHAIWNDGSGVLHRKSTDNGLSWSAQQRVSDSGGSSHLAVGSEGRLAVRVSPISASANKFDLAADYLLISGDDGKTWSRQASPGRIEWDPSLATPHSVPRWVEPLAWTDDGVLHHLWSEGEVIKYGFSADLGQSWTVEVVARHSGVAFFPFLTTNGEDKLAATWFVSDAEGLHAQLALIEHEGEGQGLRVRMAAPFEPQAFDETLEGKRPSVAGEYVPVAFLANGDLGVVTPVQDVHTDRWGFTFWRFSPDP